MTGAPRDGIAYSLRRHHLADGERTTIYTVRHPLDRSRPRVQLFRQPRRLDHWCSRHGHKEAIVGGFYLRDPFRPLGDVMTSGRALASEPFAAPYGPRRATLHAGDGEIRIAARAELGEVSAGDLVQAGPMLVAGGRVAFDRAEDHEGFSAASGQFDSDITAGRYPRAAIALAPRGRLLAVACDGRADDEAGLTLAELAEALVALGARAALNLDGGGSTSLVCAGRLRNVPREDHGVVLAGGRPVSTVIAFVPR